MAMKGLGVVPIFAGYDHRQEAGRLFQYDVTGGRYEERDHAATGSGMLHASTVVKLRYREEMSADDAVDVVVEALFQAAERTAPPVGLIRFADLPGGGDHHRRGVPASG
ncbi:MAG: hypothetical protein CM1200mP26_11650 [Acidimicrobiales bacterium]|nr:MAG: hypothetical protein CM1200mP26_11650 [Acidimicrobiales bacterium]